MVRCFVSMTCVWVFVFCAHIALALHLLHFGVLFFLFFAFFFFVGLFSMGFSCSDTGADKRPSSIYCLQRRKCFNRESLVCMLEKDTVVEFAMPLIEPWTFQMFAVALRICMEELGFAIRSMYLLLIMIVAIKWIVFSYFCQNDLLRIASHQLLRIQWFFDWARKEEFNHTK